MTVLPCPQAARSLGQAPGPPDPLQMAIEVVPPVPRSPDPAPPPDPVPAPEPTRRWPYHLPAWCALDAYWWSLLARGSYGLNDSWVRRVAEWAGPVSRVTYQNAADPAVQGFALVQLPDCWLCVIPGTNSEVERNAYILTHAMDLVAADPREMWTVNAQWFLRAAPVFSAIGTWVAPVRPVIVIGHSAGGAEAGVVGVWIDQVEANDYHKTVVTLGAPIWSTPSLTRRIFVDKAPQVIELAMPGDPVTVMPPPWSVTDSLRLGYSNQPRPEYERVGPLLDIQGNPGLVPRPAAGDLERLGRTAIGFIRGDVNADQHKLTSYNRALAAWARSWAYDNGRLDDFDDLEVIQRDMDAASL